MEDVKIRVIDSDKLVNAINEGSYDVNLSSVMALGAVMLDTKKLSPAPPEEHTEKRTETHACDLISRQDAIDALDVLCQEHRYKIPGKRETYSQYSEAWQDALDRAEGTIFNLPSAQPEQRWIPCSERLPEEDTEVLISYRYKEGEGDTDHVNIDITSYGTTCFGGREIHTLKEWRQPFDYFHANYEVIAWMPLPTPYREE